MKILLQNVHLRQWFLNLLKQLNRIYKLYSQIVQNHKIKMWLEEIGDKPIFFNISSNL